MFECRILDRRRQWRLSDGKGTMEAEDTESVTRDKIIEQLKHSVMESWTIATTAGLPMKEKIEWTKIHSYTASILNAILRDQQNRDWEKRLREAENLSKIIKSRRVTWKGPRPEQFRPWTILGLPLSPSRKRLRRRRTARRTSGRRRTLVSKQ